jgi:hypothetical protein
MDHGQWRWMVIGLSILGLASCSRPSSSVSPVTAIAVPEETDLAAAPEDPDLVRRIPAPQCDQLLKHWDRGDGAAALALMNDIIQSNSSVGSPSQVASQCAEVLRETTSMALVDVSVILDEQASAGSVSDRILSRVTAGECWLLSGAYGDNDLVAGVFRDDLDADNVIGKHCASQLAGRSLQAYTPILEAIAAEQPLTPQDCWLLRGAYDADLDPVAPTLKDLPANHPSLSSSCRAEFRL